jgi:hypothetical protein
MANLDCKNHMIYYSSASSFPHSPVPNTHASLSYRFVPVPGETADSRCDSLLLKWTRTRCHAIAPRPSVRRCSDPRVIVELVESLIDGGRA